MNQDQLKGMFDSHIAAIKGCVDGLTKLATAVQGMQKETRALRLRIEALERKRKGAD